MSDAWAYSLMILTCACAGCLWGCARTARRREWKELAQWLGLAAGFFAFSVGFMWLYTTTPEFKQEQMKNDAIERRYEETNRAR